jgi:hypothetical protein
MTERNCSDCNNIIIIIQFKRYHISGKGKTVPLPSIMQTRKGCGYTVLCSLAHGTRCYIFIHGSFSDTVNISDYAASHFRMTDE